MATEEQIPHLAGQLVIHQKHFSVLSIEDAQWVIQNTPDAIGLFTDAVQSRIVPSPSKLPMFLRPLFVGDTVLLNPTDGTRTIVQAKEIFTAGIDGDFVNWDLDVPAQPTGNMHVGVHEMVTDGTFRQIYASLNRPLHRLRLTQHQIIDFCVKHRNKLREDGYGTFFLFNKKKDESDDQDNDENNIEDKLFVANVRVSSDGRLDAFVFRFSVGRVWDAECRRRFVFPQLRP